MTKALKLNAVLAFLFSLLFSTAAVAQDKKAPASPADSVSGTVAGSTISIRYNSPSVKGRTIWGDLVPYGKVWRAGANEATRFTTSKAIKVEGKTLPAGTYALFAIPTEKEGWTIIFNKTANQWGAYKYEQGQDALRVNVKPRKAAAMNERLAYVITSNGFALRWEDVEVPVSIK